MNLTEFEKIQNNSKDKKEFKNYIEMNLKNVNDLKTFKVI